MPDTTPTPTPAPAPTPTPAPAKPVSPIGEILPTLIKWLGGLVVSAVAMFTAYAQHQTGSQVAAVATQLAAVTAQVQALSNPTPPLVTAAQQASIPLLLKDLADKVEAGKLNDTAGNLQQPAVANEIKTYFTQVGQQIYALAEKYTDPNTGNVNQAKFAADLKTAYTLLGVKD